jgi:RNA polymerase sigma factor (sigma-70 family)
MKLGEATMASAFAPGRAKQDLQSRAEELSDEDLLEQFLSGEGTDSQEAFRSLVVRHGPMVLGICRHVLNGHHDAEDAFQATFLVLARKAATIRNRRVLAGWLHEVAHRIAVKARASTVRQRNIERQGVAMSPPAIELDEQDKAAAWNELRPVLHAEVERLPERYRIPVILSYLEGKTNEEVADLLQCPVGTVKGRLSRARDLLRARLTRRGLALSAAFLATALSHGTVFAEVVPAELVNKTVRLAGRFSPHSSPPDPKAQSDSSITGIPNRAGSRSRIDVGHGRFARFALGLLLLAVATVCLTAGISMAAFKGGGFSTVRAAFSAFIAETTGYGSGCHH